MRRMAPLLPLLAAAAALGGCADRNLYPGDARPDDRVAFVEAARALGTSVDVAIDGIAVGSLAQYYLPPGSGGSWVPGPPTIGAAVLPGPHRLSIRIATHGWLSAAETRCAVLDFGAEAARRYRLRWRDGTLFLTDTATGAVTARTGLGGCPPRDGDA